MYSEKKEKIIAEKKMWSRLDSIPRHAAINFDWIEKLTLPRRLERAYEITRETFK